MSPNPAYCASCGTYLGEGPVPGEVCVSCAPHESTDRPLTHSELIAEQRIDDLNAEDDYWFGGDDE